jgi:hypothetical protein
MDRKGVQRQPRVVIVLLTGRRPASSLLSMHLALRCGGIRLASGALRNTPLSKQGRGVSRNDGEGLLLLLLLRCCFFLGRCFFRGRFLGRGCCLLCHVPSSSFVSLGPKRFENTAGTETEVSVSFFDRVMMLLEESFCQARSSSNDKLFFCAACAASTSEGAPKGAPRPEIPPRSDEKSDPTDVTANRGPVRMRGPACSRPLSTPKCNARTASLFSESSRGSAGIPSSWAPQAEPLAGS